MTDKNTDIIKEALFDMKNIDAALKANSKEILRSVMKEEIDGYMKESLSDDGENDYEEDVVDAEGNEIPEDGEAGEVEGSEIESPAGDELGIETNDSEELGIGDDTDELPLELDMTSASDDDVIAVYKKMSGDDEIEIVSNTEVKITDPTSGNEYVVKLGGGGVTELPGEIEEPTEDELGESLVYEVVMSDEDINEGNGFNSLIDTNLDNVNDNLTGKAGIYADYLEGAEGGLIQLYLNAIVPKIDLFTKYIEVAKDDPNTKDIINKAINDFKIPIILRHKFAKIFITCLKGETGDYDEETIKEKIQVGKARNVTNDKTEIVGAGGASNLDESYKAKYEAILKENDVFKEALRAFRNKLTETVVFNSNLTHVVKLFTEHSTSKTEKQQIIERFDRDVTSLKESKTLYKTIVSELGSKQSVVESVEAKLNKDVMSSKTVIKESTVYSDPSTERIRSLMNRMNLNDNK